MSEDIRSAVNIGELTLEHWTQGTLYESRDASFGALLGLKELGISYNEVPPGKSGCPFHNHHVEEELFVILSGEGEYRIGPERIAVKKGDILGAPAGGPDTAHQLINTGTAPLTYLVMSSKTKAEIVEYPDSGKFMAKTYATRERPERFAFIGRGDTAVDYWEDEPGA